MYRRIKTSVMAISTFNAERDLFLSIDVIGFKTNDETVWYREQVDFLVLYSQRKVKKPMDTVYRIVPYSARIEELKRYGGEWPNYEDLDESVAGDWSWGSDSE